MKEIISLGIKHVGGELLVLDQQKLPHEEVWIRCSSPADMVEMIQSLKIRGAPLIGVAAALAIAKCAETSASMGDVIEAALILRRARPTAINLMAAVDRVIQAGQRGSPADFSSNAWVKAAEEIFDEDVELCNLIGNHGEALLEDGDSVLSHCNAGGLATAGIGTSLGVIRRAHERGKRVHVYVDETRPLLQGARLTTWELAKLGIQYTLICDNMAAFLMQKGKIQKVLVGADRIARNGDFANKIGTYSIAVLAKYHEIPFYVAAPHTTIDLKCRSGAEIPIEERDPEEVRNRSSSRNCPVYNPAFDVSPAELATAIVLDQGVFSPSQLPKER